MSGAEEAVRFEEAKALAANILNNVMERKWVEGDFQDQDMRDAWRDAVFAVLGHERPVSH